MPRAAAALVALVCWVGLAVQFSASYRDNGDVLETLWALARFFTILTNLAVAIVMTRVAAGGAVPPTVRGGVTLAILLVGGVYGILLKGTVELHGAALTADSLLHKVSPVAMALDWLLFVPHGRLRWNAPAWWALYPIGYYVYGLARGAIDGRFPYYFMDPGRMGVERVAVYAAVIATGFVMAGLFLVVLDRWVLGRAGRMSKAPE
jgi:hypothetical protein